ncbi:glycosyltransferase [Enterovibrio norvegicus]|uniref:glycosyltransferase n=1 Tax=Enterovibrio norvegicus TaxID=188144 RepID=UPI000C82756B|nr:glycosyltransferase [Enterovibrio norvegicus]PMN67364.1 hypothetical protein BCT27_05340 [Enterovibrio norvegicus]
MSAPKKKVYFLLSSEAYLEPISGDRINEMNIIRAMLGEYEVYYNGVLVEPEDKAFGDKERVIHTPKDGDYDLIYIRNNKQVFLDSPSPKLWFASPYNKECFEQADGIVCMTKPWKTALEKYDSSKYDYFQATYPEDMRAPEICILFPQVIDGSHFIEVNKKEKIEQVVAPVSLKNRLIKLFKKSHEEKKVIRHFGPIRPSNYPYQVISALSNKEISIKVQAECVGAGKKISIPKQIVNVPRIPQEQVADMLHSADAIWYNQDASGHIAGSLKVLEAMAVGVPILLPRYDARVDELGEDYPFFWELEDGTSIKDGNQKDFLDKLNKITSISPEKRADLKVYLRKRALRHSKENVANIINDELNYFWERYNG